MKCRYSKPETETVTLKVRGDVMQESVVNGSKGAAPGEGGWANENNMFEPESDEPFWDLWDNGNDKKEEDE